MKNGKNLTNDDIEKIWVGELPEFRLLADYLVRSKVKLIRRSWAGEAFSFRIDRIYWRPKDMVILSNPGMGQGADAPLAPVGCNQIYHHAIHQLLADRFGTEVAGRPMFLLLGEAMASTTDIYFFLQSIRLGLSGGLFDTLLGIYKTNALYLLDGRPDPVAELLAKFRESAEDPYRAWVTAALGMFEAHLLFWRVLSAHDRSEKIDADDALNEIRAIPNALFFFQYELPSHVYYAATACGKETNEEDRCLVRETRSILESSRDFEEFVQALSPGRSKKVAA